MTAVNDTLTGDIVFCRYDGEINDHMTELLRYSVHRIPNPRKNGRPKGIVCSTPVARHRII